MRTTRLITSSLATALCTAALGAPTPALAAGERQDTQTPVPQPAPTWPADPHVISRSDALLAESGAGFDWDSAGIGAATVLGAIALGTAGVAVVRRRRVAGFPLGSSH